MKLYRVGVRHYSQKDKHRSIERFLVAETEEQVLEWITGSHCTTWEDEEWKTDNGKVGPSNDWWDEHPGEADRARAMGLTVHLCDWGDREGTPEWIEGPKAALLRWWRGEIDDPYGCTQFDWDGGRRITSEDAAVLVAHEVAIQLD